MMMTLLIVVFLLILKLNIRTIPTLIIFSDGVAVDKVIGFEGLTEKMPEGKEDEWSTIYLARLLGSKNAISNSLIVDDDEVELKLKADLDNLRRNHFFGMQMNAVEDEEDDFNLDDV